MNNKHIFYLLISALTLLNPGNFILAQELICESSKTSKTSDLAKKNNQKSMTVAKSLNDSIPDAMLINEAVLGSKFYSNINNSKTTFQAKSNIFTIERNKLNFLIKGYFDPFRTALNLWFKGRIVRSSTGNGDNVVWGKVTWDVSEFRNKEVYLQIVDVDPETSKTIEIESVFQSDSSIAQTSGNVEDEIINAKDFAHKMINSNIEKAKKDPNRPIYHFVPASQRMNDPNGTFYANGYYHLFYQYNPLADYSGGGYMLWGHSRSKDLVNWEHLPIALWPNWSAGELQCFSGGAFKTDKYGTMLFYTSVSTPDSAKTQWAVTSQDSEFINWKRYKDYPVIDYYPVGSPEPGRSWRDPFLFEDGGHIFVLLTTNNGVALYKAKNSELTDWEYKTIIYNTAGTPECPNFFRIKDNKWILLVSPQNPVEFAVGIFDPQKATFDIQNTGTLNSNSQYYATQGLIDDKERLILFGLIKGFKNNMGWRDCLALPRVLTFDSDGLPRQIPIPELNMLRGEKMEVTSVTMNSARQVVEGISGDAMELYAEFAPQTCTSFGIRIRCSADGTRNFEIKYENNRLVLPNSKVQSTIIPPINGIVKLRIFIDKGAIEVFSADGKVAETRVYYGSKGDNGIELFANGGTAVLNKLQAWTMKSTNELTSNLKVAFRSQPKIHISTTENSLFLKSESEIHSVRILDAYGNAVFLIDTLANNNVVIPVNNLSQGIYFVSVNNLCAEKFIKS